MRTTVEKKFFGHFWTYGNKIIKGKPWRVVYWVPDYNTGKLKRRRYSGEINKYHTVEDRLAECNRIRELIDQDKPLPDMQGARRMRSQAAPNNFASTAHLLYRALDERKHAVDPKTYSDYKSKILSLELWLEATGSANLPIGRFSAQMAADFLVFLRTEQKYANGTFNKSRTVYGSLWTDIARMLKGKAKIENVWKETKSLKKITEPYKPYTHDIELLIAEQLPAYDPQLWLFMHFTYFGFIRGSENRKSKIECIDFINRSILIKSKTAKNGKARTVALPDQLYDLLIEFKIHTYSRELYIFSRAGTPGADPVGLNYFRNRWKRFRDAFSIPTEYKAYAGKHTGMIKAKRGGNTDKDIQLQTGHHSLDQMNQYFATMGVDTLDEFRHSVPGIGELPVRKENKIEKMLAQIWDKLSALDPIVKNDFAGSPVSHGQ